MVPAAALSCAGLVMFDEEDDSRFVGLLQVEAV
jgi:hypothetical protein